MFTNSLIYTLLTALTADSIQTIVNGVMRDIAVRFDLPLNGVQVNAFCAQEISDGLTTRRVVVLTTQYVDTTPDASIIRTVLYNQLDSRRLGELFIGRTRFIDKE